MIAVVPSCSGANSLSAIVISAWLLSVSLISLTEPMPAAADLHVVALDQLAGVLEAQLVRGLAAVESSRTATTITATTIAPSATTRASVTPDPAMLGLSGGGGGVKGGRRGYA